MADINLITNLLIGLASVFCTGVLGYLKFNEERKKVAQAEKELRFQREGLDFTDFLEEINVLYKELDDLMLNTNIDRFMILRAWNGELTPRWTTAVFQVREGTQKPIAYVHFELDNDYVERLKEIAVKKSIVFNVCDIPPSAIKSVYESEEVKASMWYHIGTNELEGSKSKAVTYCSFSTQCEEGINDITATKCGIIASRLKGFSLSFN